MTKKILVVLLVFVTVFALASCKKDDLVDEPIDGAFTDVEDGTLTEELINLFEDAESSWNGIPMEPLKLLQTQVVNGMKYKFLAKEVIKSIDGSVRETYKEVIILKDLEGNTTLLSSYDYEGEIE